MVSLGNSYYNYSRRFAFRKHLQKHPLINKRLNNKDFEAGEFFVQMPLYIIENQSNVIYGNETITYKPVLLIYFINH